MGLGVPETGERASWSSVDNEAGRLPRTARLQAKRHRRRRLRSPVSESSHDLRQPLLDADGKCRARDQIDALKERAPRKAQDAMLIPDVVSSASKAWKASRVMLHLCLDVIPSHVEKGQVRPQGCRLKSQHVGLILLLKGPKPPQMGLEEGGTIGG